MALGERSLVECFFSGKLPMKKRMEALISLVLEKRDSKDPGDEPVPTIDTIIEPVWWSQKPLEPTRIL